MLRWPWSISTADFQASRRAASMSVAMSASMNWIAWWLAIGTPNWTRSLGVAERRTRARRGRSRWPSRRSRDACGRASSSRCAKPPFSSPIRWSAGISTSGKVIVAVSEARWPILSSWPSTITPASRGTRKQEMPRWPACAIGLGEDGEEGGVAAVGDEALRAGDHPALAAAHGARLDRGDVGAGVGLGQAEGDERRLGDDALEVAPAAAPPSPRAAAASAPGCCRRARSARPSSPRRAPPR